MTYSQLRQALSEVARYGGSAQHALFPVGRWLELRASGTVTYDEDAARWTLTHQGTITLDRWAERGHASPARRTRRPRSTPAIGHGPHHQLHDDVRKLA